MPVTRKQTAPSGWSQAKQRLPGRFRDQHKSPQFPEGRPWIGQLERPALQDEGLETASIPMPVGELAADGWTAPFYPDQKYFRYSQGTEILEFRLRIDYRQMLADDTASTREYYKRAVKEAAALKMYPLPTYGSVIPWELQQVIGPAPRSPKIAEAALAGDQWLLGQSTEVNEALQRLLEMGTSWTPTPEQSMQGGDDLKKLRAELDALKAELSKPKGNRKGASPEQMEQMRNARKKNDTKPSPAVAQT